MAKGSRVMKNQELLQDITYGMYLITTYDDKKVGCIINTLTQVTSENPLVAVNLNKNNYTTQAIYKTKKFAVSILTESTPLEIISTFGYQSSKENDKFKNVDYTLMDNLPVIDGCTCGHLICEVVNIVDCKTHDIIIAKVKKLSKISMEKPMTYKYYHEVLKGRSPKNAPTYIKTDKNDESGSRYRCTICGYIYDNNKEKIKFEDLPEDWKCPICKVGKDKFEKIC